MPQSIAALLVTLTAVLGRGQQPVTTLAPPAQTTIDSPSEIDKLKDNCGALKLLGCAQELFTGQPLHIAVGSIAPQNGVAMGLAYVGHKTTENWRTNWNADGVGSFNGSWRAGLYVRIVDSRQGPTGFHFGTQGQPPKANLTELPEHAVIGVQVQALSLAQVNYFGLGPHTTTADQSLFGMREILAGVNAVKPFTSPLHASVFGEINARSVRVRSRQDASIPSIEQRYTETTAPGVTTPASFVQFGEGVRIRPVLFSDLVRLNYDLAVQHFLAPGHSALSFHRVVVDLSNDVAIYKNTTRMLVPRDSNGPDECALSDDSGQNCSTDTKLEYDACMKAPNAQATNCAAITRDLQGRVGLRLMLSQSLIRAGHAVPFYFQPTLGGSDVNGNATLGSYQDERFRAPTVLLIRASFEHSVWGPLGVAVMADAGKVAVTRGALSAAPWIHSFSAGLTIRAGGIPEVYLLYSKGGPEGSHTSFTINTSLLGGTARPSVY